jgi:phosphoribosylformylglycinamidine synthase subunit PurQ / glutaminase
MASSSAPVKVGVVVFPGSCDEADAYQAIERTEGLEPRYLWHGDRDLGGVEAVVVPGGFSYGDYLRPGAIARFSPVMESVVELARAGGPVLGICNGFQVLCEAGLLPGALLPNESLRFVCRQVDVLVESIGSPFTVACEPGERLSLPVKHTTGRYFAPPPLLDELEASDRVVLRYAPGSNPNGSLRDIAGVLNEGRNVLGLMPHPEHAVDGLTCSTGGAKLFRSLARQLATVGA